MKITLLIVNLLVGTTCAEKPVFLTNGHGKAKRVTQKMYNKMLEVAKHQREVEAKLLKDVEQLTAARDRAMDAQENQVPTNADAEAESALNKAMDALKVHQKKLGDFHGSLRQVQKKMQEGRRRPRRVPVSMLEELAGRQFGSSLHAAEVKELFVKANKAGLAHESLSEQDVLNTFMVPGVDMEIAQEATKIMMAELDADKDGKITWTEGMSFVQADAAKRVDSSHQSSLLEKEGSMELAAVDAMGGVQMKSQEEQMKMNATMELMKILKEEEAKEDAKKQLREKRWKNMLEHQRASLTEREKAVRKQEKELDRLDREYRWQKVEAQKKPGNFLEKRACESQGVHTFLTTPNAAHAKCLKLQLGECADVTQVHAPSLLECNEVNNGWQKKCLNDRMEQVAQCAPAGVNWEALKKGETGSKVSVENMAIQKLQGWCTLYSSLQQVKAAGYPTGLFSQPGWAATLDQDATVSNDFIKRIREFVGQNDKKVSLVQIDPNDSPHSIVVRADAAEKILNIMNQVQAMPVPDLIVGLNEQGIHTKALEAGLAGVIDQSLLQNSELATNGLLCSPHRM